MLCDRKENKSVVAVRRRTAQPAAPSYAQADVGALRAANQEPAWLRESRLNAWAVYESLPMPGLSDEEWRRTDYRRIRWNEADPLVNRAPASLDVVPAQNLEPLIGEEQGGLLVFVNGQLAHYEIAEELIRQGVIFTDLL